MNDNNYTIHHLDLARDPSPAAELNGTAHYCVFWFRSVPLGECYLNKALTSNENFYQTCIDATWPAVKDYCYHFHIPVVKPATFAELASVCEQIAARIHPAGIPDSGDVSVVICTRNRAESLRVCLNALQKQNCKPAEIIVVDNASSSSDTRHVCSQFTNVHYIREDRVGLDIARNTGARAANASVIAYTDDDTTPDPNWVFRVFETFHNPKVAAMTGLVLAGSLKTEAEVIFEKYWPFNRGFIHKLFDHRFFNERLPVGPPVWQIGAGANMAFRKNIFEDVGYFDERLDVGAAGCNGDSELWYRILANGFTILYNPLAVVTHYHRSSVEGLKRQLYSYMRGFTVAILIQYQRFGHRGNLRHLFKVVPLYYLRRLRSGFPSYHFQNQTLFSEVRGVLAGMFYYLRHRNTNSRIYYGHDNF
jgi:GT2 family glycosyltransferase